MLNEPEFILVLLALYLIECIVRLRLGDVAVAPRAWSKGYNIKVPTQLSTKAQHAWLFLNPIWDARTVIACDDARILFVTHGIIIREPVTEEWRLITFDEFSAATTSRDRVLLGNLTTIECLSVTQARDLCAYINKLQGLSDERRAKAILRRERHSMNIDYIRGDIKRFQSKTRSLRILGGIMFGLMFFVFPLASQLLGFDAGVFLLLSAAFMTSIGGAVIYHRLLTEFDSEESTVQRWMRTIQLALYPVSLTHCIDALSVRRRQCYDAATVCLAVGGRTQAEGAARAFVTRLPQAELTMGAETANAIEEYRLRRLAALRGLLSEVGSDLDSVMAPPMALSRSCKAYCPLCLAQYVLDEGICPDCRGVRLQPLRSGDVHAREPYE
jgi:hypothetical protein